MTKSAAILDAQRAETRVLGARARTAAVGHVDVAVVSLAGAAAEADLAILNDSERRFAARLRVGADAWVRAHAALRRILAAYLGLSPRRVAFEIAGCGKPGLAPHPGPNLRFNLSHSGGIALIAVRLRHEVGVDVERVRPGVDWAAIRRGGDTSHLMSGDAPAGRADPSEGFRDWVRQEALAKADGCGIANPRAVEGAARWTVRDLDGIAGYAAAVASAGRDWSIRWTAAVGSGA